MNPLCCVPNVSMANQRKSKLVIRKSDPAQIWFLTAIWAEVIAKHPKTGEVLSKRVSRTFGYYRGFPSALKAVKENTGNMHECLYTHLVMERIGEGVHALTKDEQWFRWFRNKWTPCEKPDWARGIVNWAVG
jgi:hypothetical protein